MQPTNLVSLPPGGVVLAIQYWQGDEAAACRLARLLADIEPRRREDVTLAFCRRFDMPTESALLWATRMHCGFKFGTTALRSRREGAGHPHGPNELAAGTIEQFADAWRAGNISSHSVFLIEADHVPLRADWLDVLLAEHAQTLAAGKRVTGCMTRLPVPHVNGGMLQHLSLWHDRPSLHRTPPNGAWDLHHAQVLNAEARPTTTIRNYYGSADWTPRALAAVARETAWLLSTKDTSAIEWSERTLVHREPGALATGPEGDGDETAHATGMRRVSVRG